MCVCGCVCVCVCVCMWGVQDFKYSLDRRQRQMENVETWQADIQWQRQSDKPFERTGQGHHGNPLAVDVRNDI